LNAIPVMFILSREPSPGRSESQLFSGWFNKVLRRLQQQAFVFRY